MDEDEINELLDEDLADKEMPELLDEEFDLDD